MRAPSKAIRIGFILSTAGALLLWIAGCAADKSIQDVRTYDGPPRGSNQVAWLALTQEPGHQYGLLWQADGKPVCENREPLLDASRQIVFLPGLHTVTVSYADSSGCRSATNVVLAWWCDPGHHYELHVAPYHLKPEVMQSVITSGDKFPWTSWILDRETGEVVVGRKRETPLHWYE